MIDRMRVFEEMKKLGVSEDDLYRGLALAAKKTLKHIQEDWSPGDSSAYEFRNSLEDGDIVVVKKANVYDYLWYYWSSDSYTLVGPYGLESEAVGDWRKEHGIKDS